jgi:hypothetical protein
MGKKPGTSGTAGTPPALSPGNAAPGGKSEDPRTRLFGYLDAWAGMDESAWPEANVKALYEDIMDVFAEHPRDADGWFRAWRQAHPGARLA